MSRVKGTNKQKSTTREHGYRNKKQQQLLRDIIVALLASLLLFILILSYFVSIKKVTGASMSPLLKENDFVLISKRNKKIKRFDIIVFKAGSGSEVRRVIGLPGDSIRYVDDYLYVNDDLVDEKFIIKQVNDYNRDNKFFTDSESGVNTFQIIDIPENMYFVLGDNRPYATDSRHYGLVMENKQIGIVEFKVCPFKWID